ncbi:hypothetical protein Rsub_07773 [Raphidocelis subcapitata]|uniref:Protein kinase domain-containing protein n=1 Tax=Raphidocelis subcapitata TaxID=307507 RepID=A0A2V0PE24_9CHLO|nr:hypothetical protein Rsub_07773 [Raphidocelis subcapitata]|eukprot:GBF95345.1 hypothetical protein Rsub_07773 [Raphidocelis subcapitata]
MEGTVSGGARPVRDAIAAAARFQGARGRLGGVAADIALACGAGGGTRLAAGLVTAYVDWGLGAAPLDFLGLLPRPLSGIRQGLRHFRAVLAGGTQPPALPLQRAAAAEAREPVGQECQRQEEKAEVAEREGTAAGQGVEGVASSDEEARPARAAADLAARAVLLELLLPFDECARSGAGDACSAAEAAASAAAEATAAAVAAVERAPSPVDCGTDGPSSGGIIAAVGQPESSPTAAHAASEGGASAASALSEEGSGPLLIKAISSTSSSGGPTSDSGPASSSQSGKPELGSKGRPSASPTASGSSCAAAAAEDAPAASLSPAAIAPAPAAIPASEAPQAAAASPPAAAGPAAAVQAAAPAAGPLPLAPPVPQSLQEELRALYARIDQLTHETAWLGAELARAEAAAAPAQRAAEALRLRYHCAGALTLMGESEPGDQLPSMPVRHGSLIGVLGEGSYGTVYVIEGEDGGAPIAVKTLNPTLGCFSEGAIALFAAAQTRGAATVGRLCPALAYLPGTPADRAAWAPFATASGWHPARPSPEQAKSLLRARCHVQGGGGFDPLQDAEFVALLEHTLTGDASQPRTPAAAWVALWRRAAQQQRAALTPGEAAELEAARRAVSEAGAALASPGAHFQALQRAEARFWAGVDSGAGAPMPPLLEALQFMVLGVGARRRDVVRERVAALLPALEATSPEAAAHLAQWFGCGREAAGEPQRLPWTSAANGVATFTWCRVASERVAAARDEACGAIELSVLLEDAGLPRWPPTGGVGGGAARGGAGGGGGGGAAGGGAHASAGKERVASRGGGHEPVVDEGREASGRQQALGLGGGGDASGGARPGESPSCYHLPASEDLFC